MLYVKASVKPSPIHGLGLFAAEPIARGALVFRWNSLFGWTCPEYEVAHLPETAKEFLRRYGWRFESAKSTWTGWLLDVDDSRFVNHSRSPNMIVTTSGRPFCTGRSPIESHAARDIHAGEELTEDYSTFDPDFATYAHLLVTS